VKNEQIARCFTSANRSGFATEIAVASKPGGSGKVTNAHATCAGLYRDGYLELGASAEIKQPSKGQHPVPHLVVCVWNDRTAAVFPGPRGTCARLGLPAAARR
jgi:hypothetical protein